MSVCGVAGGTGVSEELAASSFGGKMEATMLLWKVRRKYKNIHCWTRLDSEGTGIDSSEKLVI
jgi:hypothetical protein